MRGRKGPSVRRLQVPEATKSQRTVFTQGANEREWVRFALISESQLRPELNSEQKSSTEDYQAVETTPPRYVGCGPPSTASSTECTHKGSGPLSHTNTHTNHGIPALPPTLKAKIQHLGAHPFSHPSQPPTSTRPQQRPRQLW